MYADKKDSETKCNHSQKLIHHPSVRSHTSTGASQLSPSDMGGVPFYELFGVDNLGAVWIHRKLRDHWISEDGNTLKVFIQILLRVEWLSDYKTIIFNGAEVKLKRGEMTFGIRQMAKWATMSVRNARTAMSKLKSTHTVTIKASNKFSLLTLNNWEKYQNIGKQTTHKQTNDRQTTDKRLTTLEELKNTTIKEEMLLNERKSIKAKRQTSEDEYKRHPDVDAFLKAVSSKKAV